MPQVATGCTRDWIGSHSSSSNKTSSDVLGLLLDIIVMYVYNNTFYLHYTNIIVFFFDCWGKKLTNIFVHAIVVDYSWLVTGCDAELVLFIVEHVTKGQAVLCCGH